MNNDHIGRSMVMTQRWSPLVVAAMVAPSFIGCAPRRPSGTPDREPPVVTLQVGSRSFSTEEGLAAPLDACVEVRGFPARLTVAAADRGGGGIATAVVAVMPGAISDVSVAPDTADSRLSLDRATHVLTVTPRPPSGTVQPNVLVTFEIAEFSAVRVTAVDTNGLRVSLFQVDIRPSGDPVVCRGEGSD
jgi:hypothetical protein